MKLKLLKWGLNGAIIALVVYWAQTQQAHDVFLKLASIPTVYLAAMMILSLGLMLISALRWSHLIRAFGNPSPRVWHLFRLSLIGHFFNTFVPGAVGGDVLRATITRGIYRQKNTSFLVVFCERALGLICLCLLLAIGTVGGPARDLPHGFILGGAGLVTTMMLGALVHWRDRIQQITRGYLDEIQRAGSLYWALGISFLGQIATLSLFTLILSAFNVELAFTTLLFIVPLGLLASVVPLTVFGAGARELALISLLIRYGSVDEATAVGVSTAYLGCLWFLGLVGGVFHVMTQGKGSWVNTTADVDTTQLSDSTPPQD